MLLEILSKAIGIIGTIYLFVMCSWIVYSICARDRHIMQVAVFFMFIIGLCLAVSFIITL